MAAVTTQPRRLTESASAVTDLLSVPIGGGTAVRDAHAEAVDASVLVVLAQVEGAALTLVAASASDEFLRRHTRMSFGHRWLYVSRSVGHPENAAHRP